MPVAQPGAPKCPPFASLCECNKNHYYYSSLGGRRMMEVCVRKLHRGTTCKTACHGLGGSSCIQRMGMQCLVLSHVKQHAMALDVPPVTS